MDGDFDQSAEPALGWRPAGPVRAHAFANRWASTGRARKWSAMVLTALLSGPFALLAAMYENTMAGVAAVLLLAAVAPAIEETVKIAGAAYVAEQRPWLVPTALVLPVVGLVSGLVFATVENWWYLTVLVPDPPRDLVAWRWVFGPLVHGTGSFTAGIGVAVMWRRARESGHRPSFSDAQPWLVAAAVWHGAYNVFAVLLQFAGR